MYFKRLEMHGFKSFADPVTIDFHEGVTCVVGPNGSGKSNISDAIRWVLGEQSPKALRGGKMEEVIFAGTASRKSRGMAEVTLVIDNSTHILDIDYSEVAITRRMFRSGDSEYLINNNPCRLRDIRELIMDTGIGVDGYSIIGQGKIADIVSTKPESRREIFEEAAGIVMYKSRRSEAERKLESTSQNLDRVNDIITEIEGRIGNLKEDSIKAKEYLELKGRYETLEINVILRNIENLEESGKTYLDDMERLAKEIETITTENAQVFKRSSELTERRESLDKLSEETRDRILALVEEINHITSQSQLNEERLAGIEKEAALIQGDLLTLKEQLDQENAHLETLESENRSLEREISSAEETLQNRIVSYNEAAAIQSEWARKADDGRSKLFDLSGEVTACESEISGVEALKENLARRRDELSALKEDSGKINETLAAQLREKQEEIARTEEELNALDAAILKEGEQVKEIRERAAKLDEKIERDRIEISRLSSRRKTMEEMESNYEGYNQGVRTLMKENMRGVLGVAPDLLTVPKGYEIAIETAMGGNIQNIICEDDSDAKRCIEFLKENKAGRLTFLPVSSMRPHREQDISAIRNDSGYIDLAINVVDFDSKYEGVYSYLLGKVAVVKDMDSAIRLSKVERGMRFVTLEGEIVNAQGAITGGTFRNRSANFLERKAEISELAENIAALDREVNEAASDSANLKARAKELAEAMGEKEQRRLSLRVLMGSLTGDVKAASESVDKEKANSDRFSEEMRRIDTQMAEADSMTEGKRRRREEIKEEIDLVTNEVEKALSEIENAKEETERRSEDVTKARIVLNELSTRREAHDRIGNQVKEHMDNFRNQMLEKEESIKTLEAERASIIQETIDGTQLELKIQDRQGMEDSLVKLAEEREILISKQRELEGAQSEATEKINTLRDQRYQLEIKAAKGETQLETLKEKLWEEFEISYAQAQDMRTEDFVYSRALKETREIRSRIRELGDVNVGAIAEYEQVSERYEFMTTQREDILKAKDELLTIIAEMDSTIKTRFKENFDKVVDNFQLIFKELFGGGQAELRMEDENDPLNSGIEIIAQPPGKKLQNINLMSGGEKTMTAIALMFAVLKTKPTPFCILDEVEAALDDTNIDRFADYLKRFENIQFTLVTHQKATMEHADVLYGVTMPEQGISRVLSLRLGDEFDLGD